MILRLLGDFVFLWRRLKRRVLYTLMKPRFSSCGERLRFCPEDSTFTYETISLGHDVHIGQRAMFMAVKSTITIGDQVMFAPSVTIIGGNHNVSVLGQYMYSVREKRTCDDEPVVISDDVWVGCNVTILKGVTIGRGSVVAAGAVVTKSCPPYAIIAGSPARLIRWRWTIDEVVEHETQLYPEKYRYDAGTLTGERMVYEEYSRPKDTIGKVHGRKT